jgi:hypothetical protein
MDHPPKGSAMLVKMRKAIVELETLHGVPHTEPLEMTQEQYDQLKAECQYFFGMPGDTPFNALYGVRIVIKTELPCMGKPEEPKGKDYVPRTVHTDGVIRRA